MTDKKYCAQVRDLTVSFSGHDIVRAVSRDCPERGISVLLGRSGSGKTTLLRAINRLNEEFPGCETKGEVTLDLGSGLRPVYPADAAGAYSPRELRSRVGMVFQTPRVFPVSVRKNLTLPLSVVADCPRQDLNDRMEQALRQAELWDEVKDRLDLSADRLSGGQQQRLCLARVLALKPALLLLDEPTASLDVRAARLIEDLLLRLSSDYPIIMVSHSLRQGLRLADNLSIMNQGRLVRHLDCTDGLNESDIEAMLTEEAGCFESQA